MSEHVRVFWEREALLVVLVLLWRLSAVFEKNVQGLVSKVSEKGQGLLGVNRIVSRLQSCI